MVDIENRIEHLESKVKEYKKGENNFLDNIEDYIILTLDDNKKIYIDDARGLRIDRKYKTIESTGYFILR